MVSGPIDVLKSIIFQEHSNASIASKRGAENSSTHATCDPLCDYHRVTQRVEREVATLAGDGSGGHPTWKIEGSSHWNIVPV